MDKYKEIPRRKTGDSYTKINTNKNNKEARKTKYNTKLQIPRPNLHESSRETKTNYTP